MKILNKLAVLLIALFSVTLSGYGQLLVEDFSYTTGTAITANGWTAHSSGGTNAITVGASSITYPGYLSSGVGGEITLATSGEDVNKSLTSQTEGVIYASFLVNVSSVSLTGDYFFHLGPSPISTTFKGKVFVKRDASNNLAFGVSQSANSGTFTAFSYSLSTTYLVVLKYTITAGTGNDIAAIYVNPTLNSTEPTTGWITNTDAPSDPSNIGSVAIRQGSSSNAAALKLDGIRISTSWADIVGAAGAVPTLITSPGSLAGFSYTQGSGPSASQSYNLSGTDLTGFPSTIAITGSTNFEVSLNDVTFSETVNVPYGSATLASTPVYVRLMAGLGAGDYSGEVVTNIGGGSSANLTCSGTVAPSSPTLTVGSLTGFGDQIVNTVSSEKNYTVSGINLTGDVTITPPSNFEISTVTGALFVPTSPITLTPVDGTLGNTTIYVRFAPTVVQAYAGNITHVSSGATSQNVAVSGNGVPVPPDLPFYDDFNYTDNDLLMNHGWVAHSGAGTASVAVGESNGLTYAGYSGLSGVTGAIEGNAAKLIASGEDVSSVFATVSDGSIYFSHLVNVTNATAGYYIHLGASASSFSARVFVKPSATSGKFNFGLSNTSTAGYATLPTDFDLNTTYLVIVRYDVSTTGEASLWVKPTGVPATELEAGTPEHTATTGGIVDIERICLRQYSATEGITVDGVRVGTTWASILSGGTTPVVTVNSSITTFGNQAMSTYSPEQSFTVAGTDLTDNIIVTPPVGFEISTETGAGFVATNPVSLNPTSGEVAETIIYVRFAPLAVQTYSGNITVGSPGVTTANIAVEGTGVAGEPTNHPTNFAASTTTETTIPLTWTDAIGTVLPENYLIKGSSIGYGDIADPIDGITEADGALVKNVAYGIENYTFTGLTEATTYYFKIFPYTNDGVNIDYKTAGAPQASATTLGGAVDKTLTIKILLEGLMASRDNIAPPIGTMYEAMDGNTGLPQFGVGVADAITVELYNGEPTFDLVAQYTNVMLNTDGTCVITVDAALSGDYFIRILPRTHIAVWSAATIAFAGSNIDYDFSDNSSKAYQYPGGDLEPEQEMSAGVFALYLGDQDHTTFIDIDDMGLLVPDVIMGLVGYVESDIDGAGWVDIDDMSLLVPNVVVGQYEQNPAFGKGPKGIIRKIGIQR